MIKTDEESVVAVIGGKCPDFVCRFCFTKFGWPHQRWCESKHGEEPDCESCQYRDTLDHGCGHPGRKKERREKTNEEG